jgi:uncharacterized membrane protein
MPRRSTSDWILEALAALLVLAIFANVAIHWEQLPDRVPSHYDASGHPNAWGIKSGIWVLPILALALYAFLTVLSGFAARFNMPLAVDRTDPEALRLLRRLVIVLKTVMLITLTYISWAAVNTSLGRARGLGPIFLPASLINIIVPAWFLLKLNRNHR